METFQLSRESKPFILGALMKPEGYQGADWPDMYGNPRSWGQLTDVEQKDAIAQIRKRSITGTLEDVFKNFLKPKTPTIPGAPVENGKIFGLDPKVAIGIGAAGLLGLVLLIKK